MTSIIFTGLNLLAMGPSDGEGASSPLDLMIPLILMGVIFYFLLIRPQRVRQKKLEAEIGKMKTGDKVVSAGGIHGIVTNVKEKTVVVKIAENTKIVFEKSSIVTVTPKGVAEKAAREGAKDDAAEEEESAEPAKS